jgi:hypothetical protein
MLDYSLSQMLSEHRKSFLKRMNVQGYKKQAKGTPVILDKIINSFDRKIRQKFIFNSEIRKQYFSELKKIYERHYCEVRAMQFNRSSAYISYKADFYIKYNEIDKANSKNDFIKSGGYRLYKDNLMKL